ncbi:MAG: heparinase, partial [Janthinobacterium sp.]
MTTLAWKLNRIKLMGGAEIVWRFRQIAQKKAAKWGWGLVSQAPASRWHATAQPFIEMGQLPDDTALLAAAERILDGRWRVFSMHDAPLGFPPEWNRDPKTGTLAPMILGKAIDYRSEALVGDIKYLWEPSRHLELVTL